jgi:hypothetical protein
MLSQMTEFPSLFQEQIVFQGLTIHLLIVFLASPGKKSEYMGTWLTFCYFYIGQPPPEEFSA